MKKAKFPKRSIDDLERRITEFEKKKSHSKKRTGGIKLDPALKVDSFWRWYNSSGWHKRKE